MSIEDQARHAIDAASGQHAAPEPASATALTRWGRIHADLSGFGRALLRMAPVAEGIAANPDLERAVEVLMTMAGYGAEAHEFQAIIDLGEAAIRRRQQGGGPQPQFLPAPAQDGAA
jgi:hypothetical protein